MNFNSRAHVERDGYGNSMAYPKQNFNSRAHVERDENVVKMKTILDISTHALTWSATFFVEQRHKFGERNFNSRAHVERDKTDESGRASRGNFNSRAHVERDSRKMRTKSKS